MSTTTTAPATTDVSLREYWMSLIHYAVVLSLRLEQDRDIAEIEVQNRLDEKIADVTASVPAEESDAWDEMLPSLKGLLADVIIHSSWYHQLQCSYCRLELSAYKYPGSKLLQDSVSAEGNDASAEDRERYLFLLALYTREPYLTVAWMDALQALLAGMNSPIDPKDFEETSPSPDLPTPEKQKQENLRIPKEDPARPMGRVGVSWYAVEDFCTRYKLSFTDQSWFLLLGDVGEGKTTLLKSSKQPFIPVEDEIANSSQFINWWNLGQEAMVIDVPGRMVSANANPGDDAQWQLLLDLLRTWRPDKPIEGIILTISLARAIDEENAVEEYTSWVRGLLMSVSRRLGMRPPVYIVFTKCDNLYGFSCFGQALTDAQRHQALGFVPGIDLGATYEESDFYEQFDSLAGHVAAMRPHLLARSTDPDSALPLFSAASEFQQLREPLNYFLKQSLTGMSSVALVSYRGTYFTAAEPEGVPMLRDVAYAPPREPSPFPITQQESVFSANLLIDRILSEKNLSLAGVGVKSSSLTRPAGQGGNSRSINWQWVARFAFIAGTILFLILLTRAYLKLSEVLEVTRVGHHFTLVPGGTFEMGSSYLDASRYKVEDPHLVTLLGHYYVGTFEVNQEQWVALAGENPSYNRGTNFPVDSVAFWQTELFIDALNERVPRNRGRPVGYFALLTEAEWEYAARAGRDAIFPGELDTMAWYVATSAVDNRLITHPSGDKSANLFGLFDMLGNSSEWVADYYGPYTVAHVIDPVGPIAGKARNCNGCRILRGGSYFDEERTLRPANRMARPSTYNRRDAGLRLKWVPDPTLSYEGSYIYTHPLTLKIYFTARQWALESGKSTSQLMSDMGDGIGSAWDSVFDLLFGTDSSSDGSSSESEQPADPPASN